MKEFDAFQFTEYPGDLQRVDVRKGDLFVLSHPFQITEGDAQRIKAMWNNLFEGETPPKLLILSEGAKLGVVRREDIVERKPILSEKERPPRPEPSQPFRKG